MSFNTLPPELVELIVIHCLPESFESLTLTCKAIHAICARFIEHHHTLCRYFNEFTYTARKLPPERKYRDFLHVLRRPYGPSSAYMLMAQIALEPVIARYIQVGDFTHDTKLSRGAPRHLISDDHHAEAVAGLVAQSCYLKQAGIDWKEYYAVIDADIEAREYSQYASAFILTLLPNLVNLYFPRRWKPTAVTDNLLDVIVKTARQTGQSSLAQVTSIKTSGHLESALQLLALPNVQAFVGAWCVGEDRVVRQYLQDSFPLKLEHISLFHSCFDAESIAYLLKQTPCLKSLGYMHSTPKGRGPEDLDICRLISAIKDEVGDHLEELYLNMGEMRGSILPGKLSFHGFQKLDGLGLPHGITTCITDEATSAKHLGLSLCSIAPVSVSHISLQTRGTDQDMNSLDDMFRDFDTKKHSHLPNLQRITVRYPSQTRTTFQNHCAKLATETAKQGVILSGREAIW